jgi:hypothetical protein
MYNKVGWIPHNRTKKLETVDLQLPPPPSIYYFTTRFLPWILQVRRMLDLWSPLISRIRRSAGMIFHSLLLGLLPVSKKGGSLKSSLMKCNGGRCKYWTYILQASIMHDIFFFHSSSTETVCWNSKKPPEYYENMKQMGWKQAQTPPIPNGWIPTSVCLACELHYCA